MTDLERLPEGTEERTATLATGLRMRWFERGRGPVVVCLHGFPELALSWRAQLATLGRDFRVVAPDLPGFGATDVPAGVGAYRSDRLVAHVAALFDALGARRVHLVGHDLGGAIAWDVAAAHPDRLATLTVANAPPRALFLRRLLCDPALLRRCGYMLAFLLPWLPERALSRHPERTAAAILRGTAHNADPFDDDALAPYARQLATGLTGGLNVYRATALFPAVRQPRIRTPTRMIWGARDKVLPASLSDPSHYGFVRSYDRVLIEDAGHWVQQERPVAFDAALRAHLDASHHGPSRAQNG